MNIDLLSKMLGKTGSDNDAEALAFMRRANAMVRNAGLTWDQLLQLPQLKYTIPAAPEDTVEQAKPRATVKAQVSYALDFLRQVPMSESRREFVDQCQVNFDLNDGYLNEHARAQLFGMVRSAQKGESLL